MPTEPLLANNSVVERIRAGGSKDQIPGRSKCSLRTIVDASIKSQYFSFIFKVHDSYLMPTCLLKRPCHIKRHTVSPKVAKFSFCP